MKTIFCSILLILFSLSVYSDEPLIYGPYLPDNESSIVVPDGYAKVRVWSEPEYSGGWIELSGNGGSFTVSASMTYRSVWFYVIKRGTYRVASIASKHDAKVNGFLMNVGGTAQFSSNSGAIWFNPSDDEHITYGNFAHVSSSDTTTPTPDGCQKVVFAVNAQKNTPSAKMVVKTSRNVYYTLYSNNAPDGGPFFFFIPYGSYTVVSMENFSKCNTAAGTLTVGDTFYVGVEGHTSVGYFS